MRQFCEICQQGYDDIDHSTICPHAYFAPHSGIPDNLAPLRAKKEMVRVVTKLGHYFDMDKPADFNMISFVTLVKANGHILNDHLFQPLDQVVSIFIFNVDAPPKMPGEVIQFPGGI